MTDLKPCVCGTIPSIVETYDTLQVVCKNCGVTGEMIVGDYYDEGFMRNMYGQQVIQDWNNGEVENQANPEMTKPQPTADVVEVVRCKDCKHFDTDVFRRTVCVRDFQIICVKDNDFCSYGERRSDT